MSTADGVLVIDKPSGPTSHDVVARVRRALQLDRVGHTGTLDPMATGVLPLVIGRATRLARFLAAAEKEYDALVRLGTDTDTGDATGRPASGATAGEAEGVAPPALDRSRIMSALRRWTGSYEQTPPAYSAKKIGGVRAYALARRGRPVEPRPVRVTAARLDLLGVDDDARTVRIHIVCSAGFYVRALARDLGRDLQTGAHLVALRRTRSGEFGADSAVPLDVVESEGARAALRVVPIDTLLGHLPAVVLSEEAARRAAHGHDVAVREQDAGATAPGPGPADAPRSWRLLDGSGRLIGVAEASSTPGFLHPAVVVG